MERTVQSAVPRGLLFAETAKATFDRDTITLKTRLDAALIQHQQDRNYFTVTSNANGLASGRAYKVFDVREDTSLAALMRSSEN